VWSCGNAACGGPRAASLATPLSREHRARGPEALRPRLAAGLPLSVERQFRRSGRWRQSFGSHSVAHVAVCPAGSDALGDQQAVSPSPCHRSRTSGCCRRRPLRRWAVCRTSGRCSRRAWPGWFAEDLESQWIPVAIRSGRRGLVRPGEPGRTGGPPTTGGGWLLGLGTRPCPVSEPHGLQWLKGSLASPPPRRASTQAGRGLCQLLRRSTGTYVHQSPEQTGAQAMLGPRFRA
jgi:hypothetical protein